MLSGKSAASLLDERPRVGPSGLPKQNGWAKGETQPVQSPSNAEACSFDGRVGYYCRDGPMTNG